MLTETDNWVGQHLDGRYHVTAQLGAGGMGFVYRARDNRLGCDVVVKVPRAAVLEDAGFRQRFRDEVSALVQLAHPHVVKITDFGQHDGVPFAIMQYLSGGSLEDRRPRDADGRPRAVSPRALAGWLLPVAEALDFVHRQGYVHRDIKPANILFDAHKNAYISDFGVAKAVTGASAGQPGRTGTGLVLGTPEYMAPELVLGQPFDGRIDQYALAATVYELLAGQPPLGGATGMAILVKQTTEVPQPLAEVRPGVPPALSAAVARALDKEPGRRFPDCASFAREVLAAVGGSSAPEKSSGEPRRAIPVGVGTRAAAAPTPRGMPATVTEQPGADPAFAGLAKPAAPVAEPGLARHNLLVVSLVGGLLIFGSLAVGAWAIFRPRPAPPSHAKAAPAPPAPAIVPVPKEPELPATAAPTRPAPPPAAVSPAPREEFQLSVSPRGPFTLKPGRSRSLEVRIDRAGGYRGPVAVRLEESAALAATSAEVPAGGTQTTLTVAAKPDAPAGLATARVRAAAGDGPAAHDEYVSVRVESRASVLWQAAGHADKVTAAAFSKDRALVLSGGADGKLRLWDALTGRERWHAEDAHPGGVLSVALSPDGTHALSGGADKLVKYWNVNTGKEEKFAKQHKDEVWLVYFEGDIPVSVSADHRIQWDRYSKNPRTVYSGHRDVITGTPGHAAIYPGEGLTGETRVPNDAGTFALSGRGGPTLGLWRRQGETLQAVARLTVGGGGAVKVMAVSRDGHRVLAVLEDRTVRLWNTNPGALAAEPAAAPAVPARGKAKAKPGGKAAAKSGTPPARTAQLDDLPATSDREFWSLEADVTAAALAPDGRSALLGGADGSLMLLQLPP